MKIMTCFVDSSAWVALVDSTNPKHAAAKAYFENLLDNNAKIITNNTVLDEAVMELSLSINKKTAQKFMQIIDESIITIHLRMDWISRRVRKQVLNQFLKSESTDLELRHFYILETLRRKNADIIFTFDQRLKETGFPLMPQES